MSIRKIASATLALLAAFLVPLAAFAEETGKVGANKFDVKTG